MTGLKRCLPLLALGWFAGAAGQTLSDPTRPPAAWLALQPGGGDIGDQDASSGLRLTVVGKTKKFALIDGQVVKPGDIYNGSKVLAIKPGEVVVRDNEVSRSLKVTPGVEKKVISPASRKKTGRAAVKRKVSVNGTGGQ